MNKTLHKIELFVDRIIPYLVIILFILLVLELSLRKYMEPYEHYFTMFDYFIVFVFCVDLVFKYMKVRKIPLFLRKHWIDILAVFPVFLIFRLFQEIYALTILPSLLTEQPTFIHQGVLLEKEGIRLIRAAEKTEKLSRTRLLLRFIKPIQKAPRLLKILPYFERPTEEHHEIIKLINKGRKKKQEKKEKKGK